MTTRMHGRLVALAITIAGVGIGVPAAHAEPSKNYRVQESTRCAYSQGCPRMINNAISHARTFCQAEGGVKVGESRRDFTCEQRGIYCSVTGRIECHGRLDPTRAPTFPGIESELPPRRTHTCYDADCNRYVDHAPGRREEGVHACPPGFAMAGLSGQGNEIVCDRLAVDSLGSRIDTDTHRKQLRACPPGMVVRGVSDDRAILLCTRLVVDIGPEVLQDEGDDPGLQVCNSADARPSYLTGVDGARRRILCATVDEKSAR